MCFIPTLQTGQSSAVPQSTMHPGSQSIWSAFAGEVPTQEEGSAVFATPASRSSRAGEYPMGTAGWTGGRAEWQVPYANNIPYVFVKPEPETTQPLFTCPGSPVSPELVDPAVAAQSIAGSTASSVPVVAAGESETGTPGFESPVAVQEQASLSFLQGELPEISFEEDIFSEAEDNEISTMREVPQVRQQPPRADEVTVPQDAAAPRIDSATATNFDSADPARRFTSLNGLRYNNVTPDAAQYTPVGANPVPSLEAGTAVKAEAVLDQPKSKVVSSSDMMRYTKQGKPIRLPGDDESVNLIVSAIFRDARTKAALGKVALRNKLKEEQAKMAQGNVSPEQRAKIRSRREAAVSRQNKLIYARQLEAVVVRLVEQNQALLKNQKLLRKDFTT